MFQHLERPAGALSELTRVTCPGGHIVVADPDWDTLVVDSSSRALTRALVHARCDRQRNRWIGRQLATLFRQCQLEQIAVFPISMAFTDFALADALVEFRAGVDYAVETGVVARAEADAWIAELAERSLSGRFFASMTGFLVKGQRP